nr:hypothetical protein [Tanacetum cinerariifolium]
MYGSTTNPMQSGGENCVEVDGQSSQQSEHEYINLDDETVLTQDTNGDLGERDIVNNNGEDKLELKSKRQKTSKVWGDFIQVTLSEGINKTLPVIAPNAKYDANKMREAIANWLMITEKPFSTVEDKMFIYMMKMTNQLFERISRPTAKTDCFKMFSRADVLADNTQEVSDALNHMFKEYVEMHDKLVREAASHKNRFCRGSTNSKSNEDSLGPEGEELGNFYKGADVDKCDKSELQMYLEEVLSKMARDVLAIPISTVASEETFSAGGRVIDPYRSALKSNTGMKFNALEWWNVHQLKYPVLSKMARDVLAIPISTVASEETFSAGGRVIDLYRSALKSSTVEMLLCGGD